MEKFGEVDKEEEMDEAEKKFHKTRILKRVLEMKKEIGYKGNPMQWVKGGGGAKKEEDPVPEDIPKPKPQAKVESEDEMIEMKPVESTDMASSDDGEEVIISSDEEYKKPEPKQIK